MVSKAIMILSIIDLSRIKLTYAGDMISCRIPLSLLVIAFAIILYKTLNKAIGPWSFMEIGLSPLRINTSMVLVSFVGKSLFFMQYP
jgi:hypothetical protein